MVIKRLKLKNWKNFKEVDVSLGERAFLVGPNASGKSNLLDAFRFLKDIARDGGGLQKAVNDRGGLSKIRCLAARTKPEVEIAVFLAKSNHEDTVWKYELALEQGDGDKTKIKHERVQFEGVDVVKRPNKKDWNDEVRLSQTFVEQISANQDFREVADYFQDISFLHLIPHLVRHSEYMIGKLDNDDYYGMSFLDKIAGTNKNTIKKNLGKIENALQIAVPQLRQLSLSKDKKGIPHLEAVYKHWRPRGAKQTEEQFSDGTIRLIGLLWALLEGNPLLLLEEPELSLHAGVVRKIPSLISRLQDRKKQQVIISTHSYELLSDPGIGGEEILMLMPQEEGTQVQVASDDMNIRNLLEGGLSVADVVVPKTEPENAHQLLLFK